MMAQQGEQQKPLSTAAWWLCFAVATVLMSLGFQTFKAMMALPSLANVGAWLGVIGLLTLVMIVLGYDSYVQARIKGQVQQPVRLMEWMIKKRFLLKGDLR